MTPGPDALVLQDDRLNYPGTRLRDCLRYQPIDRGRYSVRAR
jgi:hypothetical protein